jgi:hypothetical protein
MTYEERRVSDECEGLGMKCLNCGEDFNECNCEIETIYNKGQLDGMKKCVDAIKNHNLICYVSPTDMTDRKQFIEVIEKLMEGL